MPYSKRVKRYLLILKEQNGKCAICKTADMDLLHHIVPRNVGGGDDRDNLLGLCPSCHRQLHSLCNRESSKFAYKHIGADFFHDCLLEKIGDGQCTEL